MSRSGFGSSLLAALLVLAMNATPLAGGHPDFGPETSKGLLTFDKGGCKKDRRADPINLAFRGNYATAGNSAVHLHHHGVSYNPGSGTPDFIRSHGECYSEQDQAKSSYHYRLFDNWDTHVGSGPPWYTAAPGHHERFVRCDSGRFNDAVYENDPDWRGRSGFDAAAAEAVYWMQGVDTHRVVLVDKVPHKGSFSNCIREHPDWNGRIVWISI